jgi:DNA-binding transcriptional ArsR family regulator
VTAARRTSRDPRPPLTAEHLAGLLAEPVRLRVLAAVALGATSPAQVLAATGLRDREAAVARSRLEDAGVLSSGPDGLRVDHEALRELARRSAPEPHDGASAGAGLLPFVVGRALRSLPAAQGRRRQVLEHVVDVSFPEGGSWEEGEVDARLTAWCEGGEVDHVALRRYLVDARLLARRDGTYWRPVEGEVEDLGPGAAQVRAMGLT